MESFLSSDLMNDSLLNYWHTDHNPLCSLPLDSTSVSHTHLSSPLISAHVDCTAGEHYPGSECRAQITNACENISSPFNNDWKKQDQNNSELELIDDNSPQVWLEDESGKEQNLSASISTDVVCPHTHFLSPTKTNETGLFDSLAQDSDKFLDSEILTSCDLYSPLKENTLFNNEASESLILNDIDENQIATRQQSLTTISEPECQDIWSAADLLESRNDETTNVSHHVQPSQSGTVIESNHFPVKKTTLYLLPDKFQPQSLPKASNHHTGSLTPLGWLHHSAQFPIKNHIRFRKSRSRKPLLRNFQSSFFRLPIQAQNKSPQLQMVKLVRSNTNRTWMDTCIEEKGVSDISESTNTVLKSSDDPLPEDNPELALMKTVDMPSGKRVEDIYVVPSVWITSEESDGSTTTNPQLDCCPSTYSHHSPSLHISPLDDDSLSHEIHYQSNGLDTFQNKNFSSHVIIPPTVSPLCDMNSNATNSSSLTEAGWSEVGSNNCMKNLIITTLNAPKIDMVPCLKDLCQAVLNDHMPCLDDQGRQMTPMPSVNVKRLSSESSMSNNSQLDQHVYQINDSIDQTSENMHCQNGLDNNQKESMMDLSLDKENLPPEYSIEELDHSLSCEDVSKCNTVNSCHPLRQHNINIKPFTFQEAQGKDTDNSFFTGNFKDTCDQNNIPTAPAGALKDNSLPNVGATNQEAASNASMFSTSLTLMSASTSCESVHSNYDNTNEGTGTHTVSSLPEPSSSSSFIDSPFNGEMDEDEPNNPPELVSLMRQVKELHINDPVNKPLANLSKTLHLLHDAEKTLCNANFGVYQQLKMGQHSKFGQLIRCILSLTNTIVLMGKTLYEWTRSSTDHQCLKTVEVLTNLYHTNIINLIELITPYFHYICSLIASCHSDILRLNKAKTAVDANPDANQSFNKVCQQSLSDNLLTEKASSSSVSYRLAPTPNSSSDLQLMYDPARTSVTNGNQNNAGMCIQSGYQYARTCVYPPQFSSHKRTQSHGSNIVEKRQKVSLLTNKLPVKCKSSPYMRSAEAKLSLTEAKCPPVKTDVSKSKTLLINVTPNRVINATRSSALTQSQTNIRAPDASQNKVLYHHSRSTVGSCDTQMPGMLSFRAPAQLASKHHQTFMRPRQSDLRVADYNSPTTGIFSGKKAS